MPSWNLYASWKGGEGVRKIIKYKNKVHMCQMLVSAVEKYKARKGGCGRVEF